MMYAELMNIADVRAREQLQYQLHSVIMHYKYPEMFPATSHSTQFMPQTTFPIHHPQPFSAFHSPPSASTVPPGNFTSVFTGQSHHSSEASGFAHPLSALQIPPSYSTQHADPDPSTSAVSVSSYMRFLYEDPS